jgi:hypothetical protein
MVVVEVVEIISMAITIMAIIDRTVVANKLSNPNHGAKQPYHVLW